MIESNSIGSNQVNSLWLDQLVGGKMSTSRCQSVDCHWLKDRESMQIKSTSDDENSAGVSLYHNDVLQHL